MKTINKLTGVIALSLLVAVQAMATDYELNISKSVVKWNGKKVSGEHYGTINLKEGTLEVEDNKLKSGVVHMDMNSIVCEDITSESSNQRLVGHLKSDDFFSVDKHPVAEFEIKDVKHKSGNQYTLTGNLTIKDITHPVTFDAAVDVNEKQLTAKGKMEVDRTLYDIKFRSGRFFSGLGDNLIYDTFTLDFDIVANDSSATVYLK
jgi:polyisoprenoid-binding protein YceI